MKVGFDMDGVLADFSSGYRFLLEQVIGKPLPDAEPQVWEWAAALGVTREQEVEAWYRIHQSKTFWAELADEAGFTMAIRTRLVAICREHCVYFITDRPTRTAKHQTENWLTARGLPGSVLLTPHKGAAVRILDLDIYIDDKPENCVAVARESGAIVYLLRRPWNAAFTPPPAITSINSLQELFEKEGL